MSVARLAKFQENKAIIFVVLGGVALRAAYLFIYAHFPDWEMLTVDNYYLKHWAEDIASGNILGDTTYFRAPFYVYCLGLVYALFGSSIIVARLFGTLIGILSIIMTFLIGKKLFNRRVGLAAAILQAICPTVLYFEAELLLDPLFMLLMQLSVYRFIVWHERPDVRKVIWLGIALGLASITRPTALVLVLPVIAVVFVLFKHWKTKAVQILMLILSIAFVVSPVTIRNAILGKEAVLISAQGGINFYIGNHSSSDGVSAVLPEPLGHNWNIRDITYVAENDTRKKLKLGEVSSYWYGRTFEEISENPLLFMGHYVKKLYLNFSDRSISNNRNLTDFFQRHSLLRLIPLSFSFILALAILGISSRIGSDRGVRILSVTILVYSLVVALFFFNSRFRLPLIPFYLILAVVGVEYFLIKIRENYRRTIVPLILATAAGLISYLPLVDLPRGVQSQHLLSRGLHYYSQNDYQTALKFFKEALQLDPSFPETNLNIGTCYLRLGRADSALLYFKAEKSIHPQRSLSYANIAAVYLLQNKPSPAFEEASEAISRKPYNLNSHLVRLRAANEISEISTDSILALAEGAADATGMSLRIANEAAAILTGQNAFENAEQLLILGLDSPPPAIETDDKAFTPYYHKSRRNWTTQLARAHYQLGYIYGVSQNFGESIKQSRQAIELDTTLVEAHLNLARAYRATGSILIADSIVNVARRRFPNDSLVFRK